MDSPGTPAQRSGDILPLSAPMPAAQLIGRGRWVHSVAAAVANGTNVVVPGGRKAGKTSACGGVLATARDRHDMLAIKLDLYEMKDQEGFFNEFVNATVAAVVPATRGLRGSGRKTLGKLLGGAAVGFGQSGELEGLASALASGGGPHEAILGLPDRIGRIRRKGVLLFIDEVQRIADIPEDVKRTIHRVLRDSKRVTLLVAGTEEGLMRELHERPLGPVFGLIAHQRDLEPIDDCDWRRGLPDLLRKGGCSIDKDAVEFIVAEGKEIGASPVHSTLAIAHHAHLEAVTDGLAHIDRGLAMRGLVRAEPDLRRIGKSA